MQRDLFGWQSMSCAEITRQNIVRNTSQETREKYSQFLTPKATAVLAASLFSVFKGKEPIKILDMGAGTGILSVAASQRYSFNAEVTALELEPTLAAICDNELGNWGIPHTVKAIDALEENFSPSFDRVILNPPYKKMSASDPRQRLLPLPAPNLYAAFLMKGVSALKPYGELVAIIPRSWMNGRYFAPFRRWLLEKVSVDILHVYESRTEVFKDTDVLQETMILKVSKKGQSSCICVSSSFGNGDLPTHKNYKKDDLISGEDCVIQISPTENLTLLQTLQENGLCASTGKVVDFRVRDSLSVEEVENSFRLLYPQNFYEEKVIHPVAGKKPQWLNSPGGVNSKYLVPPGCYVVVKRFSPKEDLKRIKAYFAKFDEPVALENHLNFIHAGTPRRVVPLDEDLAKGLTSWLKTDSIENWFKSVSGSTQVNASDLNNLPLLPKAELKNFISND